MHPRLLYLYPILFLLWCAPATAFESNFEQLAGRAAAASEAANWEAFSALVCWQEVDTSTRDGFRQRSESDFGRPILKTGLDPIAPGTPLEYTLRGVRYIPNVDVHGWLVIAYQSAAPGQAGATRYLVGTTPDGWCIGSAKPAD